MRKQNFKSDFDFIVKMLDKSGASAGFVPYNWEIKLFTVEDKFVYTASRQYGENTNCYDDNGEVHVVVDGHEFPKGVLKYILEVEIPDENFPDGSRKVRVSGETEIEIVAEDGQQLDDAVVEITVPHIKLPEATEPEVPDTPEVSE